MSIYFPWANLESWKSDFLISGELMHDQMRADICGSLFGTRQEATFLALQRFNSTREIPIYSSLSWDAFEHANATNTSALADIYVKKNPNQENSLKTGFENLIDLFDRCLFLS